MLINTLKYQPVVFRTTTEIAEENCECSDKDFCQLVNKSDLTQWQIRSTNLVTNGTFDSNLDDWNILEALTVTVNITNETAEGECDGELVISASGGTGPYTYSLNGITFQSSTTFADLCAGCFTVVVKDSLGNLGFASACVDTNVDCNAFDMTDELLPYNTSQFLNCLTSDFL